MARILKEDWLAVPAGAIYPNLYKAGAALTGELLDRAEALGKMTDDPAQAEAAAQAEAEAQARAQAASSRS